MDRKVINVSTSHSICSVSSLSQALEGRFRIGEIERLTYYRSFINDTYCVFAGGQNYYLRIYQANWRTIAQVSSEISIIEALARAGAPVARPVSLEGGGFVLEVEAPEAVRPAVLISEAPGIELSYVGVDATANAFRYGRTCAELHYASEELLPLYDRPPMDVTSYIQNPLEVLLSALDSSTQRQELTRIGMRLLHAIEAAQGLTIGFAHGDLNGSNVHFVGESGAVIDFDCCGFGWRSNDLAAFMRGVTLAKPPGEEPFSLIAAYLKGYRSKVDLSPPDLAALPTFLLIQRIWMASVHVAGTDRWGLFYFGPSYVERLIGWLRSWECVLDTPPEWIS